MQWSCYAELCKLAVNLRYICIPRNDHLISVTCFSYCQTFCLVFLTSLQSSFKLIPTTHSLCLSLSVSICFCLFICLCLSLCLFLSVSVSLSVCLYVYLSVCLSVCLSLSLGGFVVAVSIFVVCRQYCYANHLRRKEPLKTTTTKCWRISKEIPQFDALFI